MKSMRIPLPHGHLHAAQAGEGAPLVLLHGGALNHRLWHHQIPSLAQDARVIAFDARGHGESSTPRAPFRHSDDLIAALEYLNLEPAALVGLSMGASTAVDVAVERSDLVRGLLVVGAGVEARPHEFQDPWMQKMLDSWSKAERDQDPEAWVETFLNVGLGRDRYPTAVDPLKVTEIRQMVEHTLSNHVAKGAAAPVVSNSARAGLHNLTMPVLAVHGVHDSSDHHRMAAEVAHAVKRGSEVTIDDAAHYPPLEAPADFTAVAKAWLGQLAGG